ncbi:MAG: ABC transporter permease [Planctomycetota bacterium]|nr:ABC transporter permease [Planctomycetota bacterium]
MNGLRPLLLRLLGIIGIVLVVVSVCFALMHAVPGGPFDDGRDIDPATRENLLSRYNLNAPLSEQYVRYLDDVFLHFDLGPSLKLRDYSVNEILEESLPVSMVLGLFAMGFALLVGLSAGAIAASRRGTWLDTFVMGAATFGLSVPNFVIAGLLVLLFVFQWQLFPLVGLQSAKHLVLPSIALGLPFAASIARLFRTGLLEVLGEDWIRTARSKGLSPRAVLWRHAAQPALLPVVSFLGPALAGILSGSLVIEQIFAIPGMGSHFVDSALNADYYLASGVVIIYTVLVSTANLGVDVLYGLLDPRIEADT